MEEKVDDDFGELTLNQFESAMKTVSKKHGEKYKFILKAGHSLKNALFCFYSIVGKNEVIPDKWRESLLLQKFKKPNNNSLENIRFLHIKDCIPKLFSQIVLSSFKNDLHANMTKYQIATKPGHRSTEHLFVILSLIQLYETTGRSVLITMYDIKAFFDSESVFDCLSELYKGQIRGKIYRLLFNLNKIIED